MKIVRPAVAVSWDLCPAHLEHVLDDEVRLSHHTQQRHVGPGKQRELAEIIFLDKRENKPDKA